MMTLALIFFLKLNTLTAFEWGTTADAHTQGSEDPALYIVSDDDDLSTDETFTPVKGHQNDFGTISIQLAGSGAAGYPGDATSSIAILRTIRMLI